MQFAIEKGIKCPRRGSIAISSRSWEKCTGTPAGKFGAIGSSTASGGEGV